MFRSILTPYLTVWFVIFLKIFLKISTGFDQTCDTCGRVEFSIKQAIQDRFLNDDGRILATKIVKSDTECFGECALDCRCISFSVCDQSCHLSAGSRKLAKNALRQKLGCRYYDFPSFEVKLLNIKQN